MEKKLNIFLSNQLDVLYLQIKAALFNSEDIFKKQVVVVYGPAMQSWLKLKMAQDPDLGVFMGIEIVYFNQIFQKILRKSCGSKELNLPSEIELALHIQSEISTILANFSALSDDQQKTYSPLKDYFITESEAKKSKRLSLLASHLATIFLKYGALDQILLDQHCWQRDLWHKIFNTNGPWTSLNSALSCEISIKNEFELHFFSISYFSSLEFHFLEKLSQKIPVSIYILSPCAIFWSDSSSPKEIRKISQKLLSQDISQNSLAELDEILQNQNPLLANFGKIGKEMAKILDESCATISAQYVLPSNLPSYYDVGPLENLYLYHTSQKFTLLSAIQTDIMLMQTPDQGRISPFKAADTSIRIDEAPSRRREVEILLNNILYIMEMNKQIEPKDIIVLTPNVKLYAPYIKAIFGTRANFDFQILDLNSDSTNDIASAFLALIAVKDSYWDSQTIWKLFQHPSFMRAAKLSISDLNKIKSWISQQKIYWGDNLAHREEILEQNHCTSKIIDKNSTGTWENGIHKILDKMILGFSGTLIDNDTSISFEDTDLISKWTKLIHFIKEDLKTLHDGSKLTISEWTNYLKALLNSYLKADINDKKSVDDMAAVLSQIDKLSYSGRYLRTQTFNFDELFYYLKELLQSSHMTYNENQIQAVRFCSMLPLRSIPAKIVAMIGMEGDNFPNLATGSSLNLIDKAKFSHFVPTSYEFDRYLFLEAILAAKEHLLISYQISDVKPPAAPSISILVEELISYIDKYLFNQEDCSKHIFYKHPFHSFDKLYFQTESKFKNFWHKDYESAKVYYQSLDKPIYKFIPKFLLPSDNSIYPLDDLSDTVQLKDLLAAWKHPIKFHLQKTFQTYIDSALSQNIKSDFDLKISALDKYLLKKASLKHPIDQVMAEALHAGMLPFGIFKEIASSEVKAQAQSLEKKLDKNQITKDSFIDLYFDKNCCHIEQKSPQEWILPAPTITLDNHKQIYVCGKVPLASSNGLFIFGKDALSDIWQAWPNYLCYFHASQLLPEKFKPKLVFSEKMTPKTINIKSCLDF